GCAAAQAAPDCDRCQDLPRLYREMLEQEFLRAKFQSWIAQAYYPLSIEAMQTQATNALTTAMQGNLYGVLASPAGGALLRHGDQRRQLPARGVRSAPGPVAGHTAGDRAADPAEAVQAAGRIHHRA
ncbi:hypothetical protein ACEN8K_24055, partial [Variovorax sp. CT11-76]